MYERIVVICCIIVKNYILIIDVQVEFDLHI